MASYSDSRQMTCGSGEVISDSWVYGNQNTPGGRTLLSLSYRITGPGKRRYFAGVSGGVHVFTGESIEELAGNMVSQDGNCRQSIFPHTFIEDPRDYVDIVPGLARVRTGRGIKYIRGLRLADDFEIGALLTAIQRLADKALLKKARRIREAGEEPIRRYRAHAPLSETQIAHDGEPAACR